MYSFFYSSNENILSFPVFLKIWVYSVYKWDNPTPDVFIFHRQLGHYFSDVKGAYLVYMWLCFLITGHWKLKGMRMSVI